MIVGSFTELRDYLVQTDIEVPELSIDVGIVDVRTTHTGHNLWVPVGAHSDATPTIERLRRLFSRDE